jgi:ribosomal protein S27E
MLNRLPSLRAVPSLDLPCVVCGGTVIRWSTGGTAHLASRCTRCGTVRFAPAAGAKRLPPQSLDSYRENRRAVRDQVAGNLAVIRDLTRGRRLLEVGSAGDMASVIARGAGFEARCIRLLSPRPRRATLDDTGFLAPLEQEVLSDRIYDVVYARSGLGRAPDPRAFVTNVSLLIARRGILFVNAPAVEAGADGAVTAGRLQRNAFTRGGLAELIESAGFTIVRESASMPGAIAYTARLED